MGRSYTLARDMGQGFFKDIGIIIFGLIQFFGKPHDYTSLYFEKKLFILQILVILVIPHLPPILPKKIIFH